MGRSPTVAYLVSRERILGGRMIVHRDPETATDLLVAALGGPLAAYRWLIDVFDVLESRGRSHQ